MPLCPYRTARKDKLISHRKVHTKTSCDQAFNREHKNETKTQPSSKPKESQQPSDLKRKISHRDPVMHFKYPRPENIIDPVDNERFSNNVEKQENHDHAFGEFSK